MALILRSNNSLKLTKLKDRVQETPVLSLDFRDEEYIVKGQLVDDVSTLIKTSHSRSSAYDSQYNRTDFPKQVPTVTLDPNLFNKGLLAEGDNYNYFTNSRNPTSRTVSFAAPLMSSQSIVFFWVEGTGSITVTDTDGIFVGTVAEGDVLVKPLSDKLIYNYNVEVNGSLSYVCAGISPTGYTMPITRTETKAGISEGSIRSMNELQPDVVNQILSTNEYTMVVKIRDTERLVDDLMDSSGKKATTHGVAYVGSQDGTKGVWLANSKWDASNAARFRVSNSAGEELASPVFKLTQSDYPTTHTHAVSVSADRVAVSYNGKGVESVSTGFLHPVERIMLGDIPSWSISSYSKLVEQVVIYDKALSDAQIQALAQAQY